MNYHNADGNHIIQHLPKIKDHFSAADRSNPTTKYWCRMVMQNKFLAKGSFNKLSQCFAPSKDVSALKTLNKNRLYNHNKLQQRML